jgi:hypothetical protein
VRALLTRNERCAIRVGLARTAHIRCIYGMPGREITKSTVYIKGWPEPYIYGVYTVFLAGKSPNIRSYTVYIYGFGQPYV